MSITRKRCNTQGLWEFFQKNGEKFRSEFGILKIRQGEKCVSDHISHRDGSLKQQQ